MTTHFDDSKHWAMFTKAGNKRITTLVNRLSVRVFNLLGLHDEAFRRAFRKAVLSFLKQYRGMGRYASYGEAGDTAVREEVWVYLTTLGTSHNFNYQEMDEIWGDRRGYPREQ